MRETVILRDGHCVFPGCRIDARSCDVDHIVRFVASDEGGPPGQTSASALACLCRRHHRLKTFTAWRYERLATGDYEWTSPSGEDYTGHPDPGRQQTTQFGTSRGHHPAPSDRCATQRPRHRSTW